MAIIKIGKDNIEGETQDINNFFVNNNLKLEDYITLKKNEKPVHLLWVVSSIAAYFMVSAIIYVKIFTGKINDVLSLLDFFILATVLIMMHRRCKDKVVTSICFLFGIILLLICFGVLSPKEGAKQIQDKLPQIKIGD